MEKCNLSESLGSLITKLLSHGLTPCYDEVITFIDNCQDYEDLKYLIYTLNYLKEDSLLLKLKIQDYELRSIIKYLENLSSSSCSTSNMNELTPSKDGFIYIDASDIGEKEYYQIPNHLIGKIKLIHIDYPEEGLTKIYYERSIKKEEDGTVFEYYRELTFDHTGLVTKVSPATRTPLTNFKHKKPKNADTIYKGLVGELFDDLLKQAQNTEVTINDL